MVRRNNPVRIDPDVDLRVPADRSELSPYPAPVLLAVSAGGALGAACRWSLDVALPHPPGGFPWATFAVNVAGSLLIGVVMAVVTGIWSGRRLVRPFLAVGLLGGFTTFSTYVVDVRQMIARGSPGAALLYLVGTPLAAVLAVLVGTAVSSHILPGAGGRRRGADQEASRLR
ncbi:MAG TPA: CrcB family protein [Micromonosporaceae bacterium]